MMLPAGTPLADAAIFSRYAALHSLVRAELLVRTLHNLRSDRCLNFIQNGVSVKIYRDFTFEAAHRLTSVPKEHKCARLHGHSFRCQIMVDGPVDSDTGWVMDFAEIKDAFEPIRQQLDHNYLNDIDGLSNPTSENLARWIWRRLKPALPSMTRVLVSETCNSGCVYEGEDEA